MLRKLSILLFIFSFNSIFSQSIIGEWFFENVQDSNANELFEVKKTDLLSITENDFKYNLEAKNNLLAEGSYSITNNKLSFKYNTPSDTLRTYDITLLSRNELEFTENGITYKFKKRIIANQGFSLNSFLRGLLGMFVLILISYLLSANRKAINWKTVILGLGAQIILAIGVLKVPLIQGFFEWVGSLFIAVLDFTLEGTKFLFASFSTGEIEAPLMTFAISILPTVIFFSALTSVLFYLGIIQRVVKGLAWLLSKLLQVSGAESLSVAGNIFLGQTESPLMIKAYLEKMNRSEILLVMIGGMATVAGGVLAAYIAFLGGDDEVLRLFYAKHLLTASVMAAPGAIVISKMLYPQVETIDNEISISQEKIGSNILESIANGTTEGLKLALNIGAMLLVFLAFIAMINGILGWVGEWTTLNDWIASNTSYKIFKLEFILGYIFAPLMWLIGIAKEDIALMGQLLGIKLAASEFVGYIQLAELKNITTSSYFIYQKSIIMATYMLCGFANFASIGIQIGGIGSLAPGQRKTLSEFGIKALIGGTIASLLSATIAGAIIG
ncbi:Na+ dependent nucleoside transporter [Flavobacteriaceae bacterium]|jgi:concentrative nucleoside transporter, CNT family|nr:Na+ dependent nucleoside transporter [Flavobacteriaceae bacterium]MDA9284656.1 Na+ dependent nucleoside transporter [Flavobacteriaceae bacterium]MDB4133916.1 Na+ dependent nucleoside transporter [Flavobacteriaceae bacterium]MDB4179634.1 Na+ dependent nucleoside transporter [Flavobacteriaceae bacterium]MDB4196370.1 Na+ dependent nucleoside transporter [Flavobacteriaceae bacterium]|tara:strand:+ start:176 stop:1843 length:1668 start_codon:yes stop_codon:yes gene_type:complete